MYTAIQFRSFPAPIKARQKQPAVVPLGRGRLRFLLLISSKAEAARREARAAVSQNVATSKCPRAAANTANDAPW